MAKKAKRTGRPSTFDVKKHVELAHKVALLGATDKQIADVLGITEQTVNAWKKDHPAFSEALKTAKLAADGDVAKSLYRRALGYSHPAVKILQYEGQPVEVPYTEHYPPDTTACIFWLKNRWPSMWRDRVDNNHTVSDENNQAVPLDELARRVAFLLAAGMAGKQAQEATTSAPTKH